VRSFSLVVLVLFFPLCSAFAQVPKFKDSKSLCDLLLDGKIDVFTTVDEIFDAPDLPYIRKHYRKINGGPATIQTVVIDEADYSPELEQAAADMGYLALAIRSPSDQAILAHPDYILAAEWVRWVMETPKSEEAWLASMSGDARRQTIKKLQKSAPIRTEFVDMNLGHYDRWHREMFLPYVVGKDGGTPAWPPVKAYVGEGGVKHEGFVEEVGVEVDPSIPFLENKVPNWYALNFYKADDTFVGAMMIYMDHAENESLARIRNAGYEPVSRDENELALRGTAILAEEARKRGIRRLSYGDDPNLSGVDMALGLARFKATVGMTPIISVPWSPDAKTTLGKFQLIKVFKQNVHQARIRKDGRDSGLFVFAVPGAGEDRIQRYSEVKLIAGEELPYETRMEMNKNLLIGLQICMEPNSDKCKMPKNMTLHQTEAENITVPVPAKPE
jgi:hypothetical protein